ncbi:MAG: sulfotransferase [Deltaproteobacteria bacterium]|nr:sulfotransferase [Deltaproteobacteria bacterium]
MKVKLPNFLIVGTAKSGTTSIYQYLKQHPEIYVPANKEPRFFVSSEFKEINPNDPFYKYINNTTTFTFEDYERLFDSVDKEKAIGEASVQYLYFYNAAIPQIKKYLGNIKIIMILRNPVERAFSAYSHYSAVKAEVLSFEQCLDIEQERRKNNWAMARFYKDLGFYYKQVYSYTKNFSQVKVYLYDDLKKNSSVVVRDLYEFLEVDPSFVPYNINIKYNVSGVPQIEALQSFFSRYDHPLKKLLRPFLLNTIGKENTENLVNHFKNKNLRKEKIKPETKKYLIEIYRDDILMLGKLIKRDLSAWLK